MTLPRALDHWESNYKNRLEKYFPIGLTLCTISLALGSFRHRA